MTKTTRKNIKERIVNMMKERNIELEGIKYGDEVYKVTQKQFDEVVEVVFSNLGADLKKNLEVWKHEACGYICIRTYTATYAKFVIVEESEALKAWDNLTDEEKEMCEEESYNSDDVNSASTETLIGFLKFKYAEHGKTLYDVAEMTKRIA